MFRHVSVLNKNTFKENALSKLIKLTFSSIISKPLILKIVFFFFLQKSLSEKLKEEEEERLCTLAQPLRHYLTTYIFPTLTQALIEVAKLRPEDPIDFLVSN